MVIRKILFTLMIVATALMLAACGPEPQEAVVLPTRTPRPTFTPTPIQAAPVEQIPTPTLAAVTTGSTGGAPVEGPAGSTDATPGSEALPPAESSPTPEPPTPEPPTATSQPDVAMAVVTSPQVNLRSGPGTNFSIAGSADRGAELPIVGKNPAGDWWQVTYNGQQVWIASFLVDTTGPVESVSVAANFPAVPPTATPQPVVVQPTAVSAPPTATPEPPAAPEQPTAAPAPGFTLSKGPAVEPRPNSNPYITFFGWICKTQCPSAAVGGYKMIVEGPAGRFETNFEPSTLVGDPGLGSEFWYNAKLEIASTAAGNYRVWVADPGGNQVGDAWEYTVEGTTRTFLPRWIAP